MPKKYDAAVKTGEYTDRNGEQKARWLNVGAVFENDRGQLSLKLEAVPVGDGWNGWVSFFEPRDPQQQGRQGNAYADAKDGKRPASNYDDDSMPF